MTVVRLLTLSALVLAAATIAGAAPPAFTITLESSSPYYEPAEASVAVGRTVVWINPTPSYHTIQHDGCEEGTRCAFNSGSIAPNGRYVLEQVPPGEYRYHCELHPIMRGVLVVTPTSGSTES